MATAKKTSSKKSAPKAERRPTDVETFLEMEDLTTPPDLLKESKYPWRELMEGDRKNFVIPCESSEEATRVRSVVFSSGRNYFLKRRPNLMPIVRRFERDGDWYVAAFVKEIEE